MTRCISFSSNTSWNLYNFRGNLIRHLLDDGYQVATLSPVDSYSEKLASLGCKVIDIPMDNKGKNPISDFKTYLKYRRAYRVVNPDLALHYTIKPNVYGTMAAKSLGIPTISTISGLGTAFLEESWLTKIVEGLYKVSQKWPREVFFQNPDDYEVFRERKLIDECKMHCVPGSGVDLDYFSPVPYPERSAVTFLLYGRLLLDKGVREYVDAAQKIKAEYPDVRFQLLGPLGVSNRSAIAKEDIDKWRDAGMIEYLGKTEDVRPYIENADCVVLPSYREGTPKTLLETAAMARPMIATDVPGCREVVDDGVNGLLCRAKSSDDLADKMRRFLEMNLSDRQAMGLAGRKLVEEKFDEKIVIARYMQAISDAINKP